jgi:superfamily II DNA or RNA helicase/diadenosine tetraphosphate (Ap4A) HIT family hydrolase
MFLQSELVFGLWDAFPVAPGHALLVTRRHVATWFDASTSERQALSEAIEHARSAILRKNTPDGFNVGINVGEAAGQTIHHLHVHVIPRHRGDVFDPRGGVRHVIPSRANYLATRLNTTERYLITGNDDPLLPHLVNQLAVANQAEIVVSFALESGVDRIFPHCRDLLERGGRLRLLTGDYLGITEPNALMRLLDLEGNVECRVFETGSIELPVRGPLLSRSFHPKAYIFRCREEGVAFVGSSNLSESALTGAVEWNYRVVSSRDRAGFEQTTAAFDVLFQHHCSKPLTADWVAGYRARRPVAGPILHASDVTIETPKPPVTPTVVQRAALDALSSTRAVGNKAGLVVLATGLGKTWLSAFDCSRPECRRVLFVAHREEILNQALDTFRRVRPNARLGHYTGEVKDPNAEVMFASIQTLSRREHLERFSTDAFDYIVVDEFHHASAASYRRLIEYFQPSFLLGLTATPERSDGGDLLALCQQNLVYRCDLVEGVHHGLLAPFHYYGVPDDVDYTNIPWRSNRFDEEELTSAVATTRRAENALEQLRAKGGKRALGFCVSQRHADFMSSFFNERGVRSVAVHSGPTSSPRSASLEQLEAGDLDIVFAVDMFNEGVDLPALDTVMMLRPTESKILWLQQFGRGLRRAAGKERLTVIDYIGNHRVFLLKPQTLFGLKSGDREIFNLLERLQNGTQELPPGCEVTYELQAVDILKGLLRRSGTQSDALERYYRDFKTLHGVRPTATEAYEDGYNPRAVRDRSGSWVGFVLAMGDLDALHKRAFANHEPFITALDTTEMVKSYKMLVLLAMLNAEALPGAIDINDLADQVVKIASRTTRASSDLASALGDRKALIRLLEQNPIAAWVGGKGTSGISYFEYKEPIFRTVFNFDPDTAQAVQELVREVAEWRLTEYLDRAQTQTAGYSTIKVSQSNGKPILFLPAEPERSDLPNGWTDVLIDGKAYSAHFVKIAVNVLRQAGDEDNVLPRIVRGWFGPDAGAPGTRHTVALELKNAHWHLSPIGRRTTELQLWRSYSREEIPALFGFPFSTAIWNAGFVKRPGHIFLLVTLDKSGHDSQFHYKDHFTSRSTFEWQSQNRTTQASKDGQDIRDHMARGIAVHLFVRTQKKSPRGGAAPFVYCGDVAFVEWSGEQPITVRWDLSTEVPQSLWSVFAGDRS